MAGAPKDDPLAGGRPKGPRAPKDDPLAGGRPKGPRANAMFRSIVARQLKTTATTGAFAGLALAALSGALLAFASSGVWWWVEVISLGWWLVLAVVMFVASTRILQRPAVVELFENAGSIVQVTIGSTVMRVILRSGTEVRIPVKPREVEKFRGLLRGHSPKAEFLDH